MGGEHAMMAAIAIWPTFCGLVLLSFLASALSAIAGFGGGMLILPFLATAVGADQAVIVLTVMLLVATPSRAAINRRALRWRIVAWYGVGATLGAALGAAVYLWMPKYWLLKVIGAFLLTAVAARHVPGGRFEIRDDRTFAVVGVGGGFVAGVVGGMGPVVSPFFLAAGLSGTAFVGTLAACAVWMHVVKMVVYATGGALMADTVALGLALGLATILGTLAGTRVLRRMGVERFQRTVEVLLAGIGLWFLMRSG